MASAWKAAASCLLLASLLPFLLPFLALAISILLLFFLPLASVFLSLALLRTLANTLLPSAAPDLLCQNAASPLPASNQALNPDGFLYPNAHPQQPAHQRAAVMLLAAPAPLAQSPHLSCFPTHHQWETHDAEPLLRQNSAPNEEPEVCKRLDAENPEEIPLLGFLPDADKALDAENPEEIPLLSVLPDADKALDAENPEEIPLLSVLPDADNQPKSAQCASLDDTVGEPLQESTEKLIVCKPELVSRVESFDEVLTSDSSLYLDVHSDPDAGECSQILDENSSQIRDTGMERIGTAEGSQFPDDQKSDGARPEVEGLSVEEGSKFNDELSSEDQAGARPEVEGLSVEEGSKFNDELASEDKKSDGARPEVEGLSVEEGSKFNDELASEDQTDAAQAIDVKLMDWSASVDANASQLSASTYSRWDGIAQDDASVMSDEQASTKYTNHIDRMLEEQPPKGSTEVAQSNGFPDSSESWNESFIMEDKQEDFRSCATSLTESIKEPIVDANSEVKSSKEMTLLADINEIKKILGYHDESHESFVEQIRALYMFVGITPSADVGNMDQLEMAMAELEVLRAVIGVQ